MPNNFQRHLATRHSSAESHSHSSPERPSSHETLYKPPEDSHEKTRNRLENKHETQRDKIEKVAARQSIEKEAIASNETRPTNGEQNKYTPRYFTKVDRERSFKLTMRRVRSNFGKPQKAFSSLIHQPTIEKVSQVAGKTIARPSGIIGATSAALIGIGFVLIIAKRTGFTLAGSEFWILLCIGYLCGLIVEAIKKLLHHNKKIDT